MNKKKLFLSGVHDGIPVSLGYFAVSFALVVLIVEAIIL